MVSIWPPSGEIWKLKQYVITDNGENGMNLLCNLQPRLLGGIHCVQILEDGSIGSEISLMDEVTHKQISRSSFEEHY